MRPAGNKFWIETLSGKKIDLRGADAENIDINDIACGLSKTARFNGQTKGLLSVAYHCINVERLLREWRAPVYVRLYGLLHDAPEAYCHDLASPWKSLLPEYRKYEYRMMRAILAGLGLDEVLQLTDEEHALVKRADSVMLITERRDFKTKTNYHYHKDHCAVDVKPLGRKLKQMGWRQAEKKFLKTYDKLVEQL